MDKRQILDEIKRVARANGGKAPGGQRFERESGIRKSDWYPYHWLRWGDALLEAGLPPNKLQTGLSHETLLEKYIGLIRELKRLPVQGEMRRKAKQDPSFPSSSTFQLRLGGKSQVIDAVVSYCNTHKGFDDVMVLCEHLPRTNTQTSNIERQTGRLEVVGFVYLMKSGRHYKIGRTNASGRRERELAIQLPEKARNLHAIKTDDPPGIEAYWHRRFESKRGNGEWFNLTREDVKAFTRRKFM